MDTPCIKHTQKGGKDGYGQSTYMGKRYGIHVVALIKASGELPNGRVCMHECDNPRCINPEHLSWGTPAENSQDCARKGRAANNFRPFYAEEHHKCVLDAATCRLIRTLYKWRDREFGTVGLGRRFGVSTSLIQKIINGTHWSQK